MKAGLESLAEMDDICEAAPAVSDEIQRKAESSFETVKLAIREYRFVKDSSFSEPEVLHELEPGSGLFRDLDLVLADPLHSPSGAWGQASFVHDMSP